MKNRALEMRKDGHSLTTIAEELGVSRSTASLWVRTVILSPQVIHILKTKQESGRQKGALKRKDQKNARFLTLSKEVSQELSRVEVNNEVTNRLLCSFLYWGEGGKSERYLSFINSDPEMIRAFLSLLRSSFTLDESKFRALLHVHSYHNEEDEKQFWSEVTNIPLNQFTKSFIKHESGINIKPNYKGTLRIRYYDAKIADKLKLYYQQFAKRIT